MAQDLFPEVDLIISLDGAFATAKYLKWALENNIKTEVCMYSNRIVEYNGKKMKLRDMKEIRPKGRQMARTIQVIWQELSIQITAVRRIDRNGEETIVFQAATYQTKPSEHAQNYKWRWGTEKMFRTTKQYLGLQECFSTKIVTQFDHICAVLLAYSRAQLEMKSQEYKNPEAAIRAFKLKKHPALNQKFNRLDQNIDVAYA